MPFEMTPNVHVTKDRKGVVRVLSHVHQPYGPAAGGLEAIAPPPTPRALAEQYLRDMAPVFNLTPQATAGFEADFGAPAAAGPRLAFKEEKTAGDNTVVSYAQTEGGLPVWDAGLTVRLHRKPLQVTGTHNHLHYQLDVHKPGPEAPYLPGRLGVPKLRQLLNLDPQAPDPEITSHRLLIYRYAPEERFDRQAAPAAPQAGAPPCKDFPTLPLPAVPAAIQADRHYVVTEVLFRLPFPGWGKPNWRAFIEPDTGAVLYLRALVSCATGSVFRADPATLAGQVVSVATPTPTLDGLRSTGPLQGLKPPAGPGAVQQLCGEFVCLQDLEPPSIPMPTQGEPYLFDYSCKTREFAAVQAYHACDYVYRLIQGMGIDVKSYFGNTSFPVPVDPHGFGGAINARAEGNAMGNGMGGFFFGVAAAGQQMGIQADLRVVIHEFGHALLWDHVSSPNFGFAHSAGDSLAVILFDPDSAPSLGRFETFPFMNASAGLSRRHDRDVAQGWAWGGPPQLDDTQYGSEQILSTTLFRIYRAAGGDSQDAALRRAASRYVAYLIIKAIGTLTFTTSEPEVFASALIDADAATQNFEGQPGGAFSKVIRWSFEKQGLFQPAGAPAPVSGPGDPPDVDVYIDDGGDRNGEYMPYPKDIAIAPAVWNRQAADGGQDHQPPAVGAENYLYAFVRNRGTKPAANVTIKAFQAKAAGAAVWPTDWVATTTPSLSVAGGLAPGGKAVVGPFAWTPTFAGGSVLLSASADGDPSNADTVTGPIPNVRLVPLDNNVAQRAM
jgi:hypothetical protein